MHTSLTGYSLCNRYEARVAPRGCTALNHLCYVVILGTVTLPLPLTMIKMILQSWNNPRNNHWEKTFAVDCVTVHLFFYATIWLLHIFVAWNVTAILLRWKDLLVGVWGRARGLPRYVTCGGHSSRMGWRWLTPILSAESCLIYQSLVPYFKRCGHSPHLLWGRGEGTHLQCIYYLMPYNDLDSRGYFGV